jgi:carbon-monoxide dehydrogenase catalytic subunit
MAEEQRKFVDGATQAMLEKAGRDGVETAWDRHAAMEPQCKFGSSGLCCRNCFMGPCRVVEGLPGRERGVCGATASTIVSRNFARMVAAGTAAHSDHGRSVAETLLMAATGKAPDYSIRDVQKLNAVARIYGIDPAGKSTAAIAELVGLTALSEFGKYEGEQRFLQRAPEPRRKIWKENGIAPRAVDREVTEVLHRTTMGVDQDYRTIIAQASRCALADGWGGSMIATELQDILFGTPIPRQARANLGVLREDTVNIIIHGHEPTLSEMIVLAAQDPQLIAKAKAAGAKGGITVAGMCCTANETLMRHGVPIAGNSMQQELALATGAVEAMVVDVQCIMQSVARVARSYHSKIITTSSRAHIAGALHMQFDEHRALEVAREIVSLAIDNFQNRGKVQIPSEVGDLVVGFSHETIRYMLGGRFRASYRPLNDNIMNGRIRGVVGVVGCNSPKFTCDAANWDLVTGLISKDILVVQTGCMAIASGKQGLLQPEVKEMAGPGLREICDTVGIPPVLHAGSCVDNSRILIACSEMVREGGLGADLSDLPVAGCAPEWMSEKAVAIGQYFVASGALVVFGVGMPIEGSREVRDYLTGGIAQELGGRWAVEPDPRRMAQAIREHIESKRDALGINEKKERKLFDMADRRELKV